MMQRGVIVRHLLLPGHKKNARDVIRYVFGTYGDAVFLSLLNQYTPFDDSGCGRCRSISPFAVK